MIRNQPRTPAVLSLLVLGVLLAGCDDPAPIVTSSSNAATSKPVTTTALPAQTATVAASVDQPADEVLTAEALVAANTLVNKGDELTPSAAALYQELGKPTRTTSSSMIWGVATADACTVLRVDHQSNNITEIHPAKTVSKSNAAEFEACTKALGQ